jgi:hypothetical protein
VKVAMSIEKALLIVYEIGRFLNAKIIIIAM